MHGAFLPGVELASEERAPEHCSTLMITRKATGHFFGLMSIHKTTGIRAKRYCLSSTGHDYTVLDAGRFLHTCVPLK